jgi:hypothetical protein
LSLATGRPSSRDRRLPGVPERAVLACVLLATLLVGSCAPARRGVAPLDLRDLATRYEAQRAGREERLAAVRLEATGWIDGAAVGRLPAVQLELALVAPDRVRARVASLFGTALDLLVRGDSLVAYVPPRRMAVEVGALEDSLGIREPGRWACRALAATWAPREARWQAGSTDSLRQAFWVENGDSLDLEVASRALPEALTIRSATGRTLVIRYPGWQWSESTAWPSRIEIEDAAAGVEVALRIDRIHFEREPDPRWLALAVPSSAERLDWRTLKEILARMGGVR